MAGFSGINNYSFLFTNNTSANNNLAGLTNSLFGASSGGMLGDYAMIKSGSYKKLLTAYYKTEKEGTDDSSAETQKVTAETRRYNRLHNIDNTTSNKTADAAKTAEIKNQYLEIKNQASDLRSSANALNSYTMYNEKTNDKGETYYDRDSIKKAVKSFVTDYNTLITVSGKVNSSTMSGKMAQLTKLSSDNEDKLNSVGITIGADGKLALNEEKLASADMDTLKSLFKGTGAYANNVSTKASEIARQANSSVYNATKASSYSQSGSYSVMGNTNNMLNQLF